jgi:predicted RNA-binding protein with PIN domain
MTTVIVDGDNVVRALRIVRGADTSPVEEFLQKLELAAVSKDWEVIVVFDGPQRFTLRESGPLIVRYATGKTADTMIERLVYQAEDKTKVIVVTHDHAEANLVLGFGARVWDSHRLLEEMKE